MKKNLSVLALLIRLKMKWILITLIAMPVVSWALFFGISAANRAISFRFGKAHVVFTIVFAIGSFVVVMACGGLFLKHSSRRYLFERLQVSERRVLVLDVAVSILFLLMLWMMEIIMLGGAAMVYNLLGWNRFGTIDMIYGLYGHEFYCRVLPLSDIRGWFEGLFYVICGGVSCACLSMSGGKKVVYGSCVGTVLGASAIGFYTEGFWVLRAIVAAATAAALILCIRRLHNGKERSENETFDC
ncbi:MAG: hypothetical protein J5845_02255 [Lachnospiraceae bacterium]|nr:hypothetical protein [Lachnospiraceae bacterium]